MNNVSGETKFVYIFVDIGILSKETLVGEIYLVPNNNPNITIESFEAILKIIWKTNSNNRHWPEVWLCKIWCR